MNDKFILLFFLENFLFPLDCIYRLFYFKIEGGKSLRVVYFPGG